MTLRAGAWLLAWAALSLAGEGLSPSAHAAMGGEPIHSTGDRQLWHRKENRVELFGHAMVSQPGETLTADYISLDSNSRVLDAKGNCVYIAGGSIIYGEEMHFNLDTRTGSIVGGRVSNSRFTLSGERINKLAEGRFQTHWGEYSTCRDCPGSWSLMAEDVDMQIEGYAFMNNVVGKVQDNPAFWVPYLIVPMKTRRQSGLLFPSFSVSTVNGFAFVVPFFWAINDSSDMTIGVGDFTRRGVRFEWEGRYALSQRSSGTANFYLLSDRTFVDYAGTSLSPTRWALNVGQTQELPFGIEAKLKLTEVSDNAYPREIGDVPGAGELNLASSLSLSYASSDVSAYVALRRYRTLVNTHPDPVLRKTQFDPRTVQAYPTATVTTNDQQLFGTPLVAGLTLGVSNFTRAADTFDFDSSNVPFGTNPATSPTPPSGFELGVDPIRKATRFSLAPSLYTTFRPFDILSFVPSVRYYNYLYAFPTSRQFPEPVSVPVLHRDYLHFQADLSAQIERVFEYPEDRDNPRVKHLIRPVLTYSYIPTPREDQRHPFLRQINYATRLNRPGYYFDDYDIVPTDTSPASTNYFNPLGNSLAIGLTTQWIRRQGALDSPGASYSKFIEATAGEVINFREYQKGTDYTDPNNPVEHQPQPFSRFFTTLELSLGRFSYSHLYYYYPYIPGIRHSISTSMGYSLESGVRDGLFLFDRSLSMNYSWDQHGTEGGAAGTSNLVTRLTYSLSDYILPSGYLSYSFVSHQFLEAGATLQFQSPARCWKFTLNVPYRIETGVVWNVDLALNLTGGGFGGVGEIASQAMAPK